MERVKLGDVLLYRQPTKFIVKDENYHDSFKTPVLTAGKSFILGYTNESEGIYENVPCIIFDDFTTATKFVDFPFKVKSSAMKILECKNDVADIKYLYYQLLTIKDDSSLHKRFWISKYSQIEIPLPALSEQKKIAAILDRAQEVIACNRKTVEKYEELKRALFLQMFGDPVKNEMGWEVKNIKKMSIKFTDGPFGSNLKTEHYTDDEHGGIQVIRLQNIGVNQFVNDDRKFIHLNHYENVLSKYTCFPGDVVIATMGNPNIRACVIPNKISKAVNKADCVLFRPNTDFVHSVFLSFLINSNGFLSMASKYIHGQTRLRISSGQIAKIFVPIPPIELQNRFAELIENIEHQQEQAKQSLQKSEELFGSLLQRAFNGELLKTFKEQQKKYIIEMMHADEEDGLYED